jgi:hypothetical protein
MSMDAPVMYGALNVPRPCRHAGRPDTGKKQAETAGFLACQGMLHKYLAAARDHQFLVGQDLHEAAAPMGDRELTASMVAVTGAIEITVHGWDIFVE